MRGVIYMRLNWDDSLSTGIINIDNQHKELLSRLSEFLVAMEDGKGKNEIKDTLDFLEEYVIKHFNDEEEIQKKNNYPKYNLQHQQHEAFKEELKKLRATFDKTGESVLLALNIQGKIINWVKNHIMTLDKELGEFLIENKK